MGKVLALFGNHVIGTFEPEKTGLATFSYETSWRNRPDATPLSLSLPLSADRHGEGAVAAVLWGLLPDSERTLQRWATRFQVSARNPLSLLANVGEDCAGAIQLVRPERLDSLLSGETDRVRWLDEQQIAVRLRHLRADGGAAREPDDEGQFSLAGAQAKTALFFDRQRQRWGVPSGRKPTSHILKPPSGEYEGYAENEHFCQSLAKACGLPAATSEVVRFADELAICVERYDRLQTDDGLLRVHQEDFCQALGTHPANKYQNEGGPSPEDLAGLLQRHSTKPRDDVVTLFRALVFNWLIAGSDAHAKNYSLLLAAGGRARLAPLYDLSSAHPYPSLDLRRIKMAMKVGSHYRWAEITTRDWLSTADRFGISGDDALAALREFAEKLADVASTIARTVHDQGAGHPVIDRIVDGIARASERQRHAIDAYRTAGR